MVPTGHAPIVDVGADHGHLAARLSDHAEVFATERAPHRAGRSDVRWVIADGLAPFRQVGVAILAGMGAHTIAGILARGPRPAVAVIHVPDDPPTVRTLLAADGWRIDAEGAVAEGSRLAEVIRVVPGQEPHRGAELRWGPLLAKRPPQAALDHWRRQLPRVQAIAAATKGRDPDKHTRASEDAAWLTACLHRAGVPASG